MLVLHLPGASLPYLPQQCPHASSAAGCYAGGVWTQMFVLPRFQGFCTALLFAERSTSLARTRLWGVPDSCGRHTLAWQILLQQSNYGTKSKFDCDPWVDVWTSKPSPSLSLPYRDLTQQVGLISDLQGIQEAAQLPVAGNMRRSSSATRLIGLSLRNSSL